MFLKHWHRLFEENDGDGGGDGGAGGDGGGAGGGQASWPDDWRTRLAGDDAKLAKRLERFTEPGAIVKSWLSAEQKISSGEFKSRLPENATPEQLAAFRKEHGIPEAPEGYFEKLPDGLVIGEDDKEGVAGLAKELHELNAPPSIVHKVIGYYNAYKQSQMDAIAEKDTADVTATEDTLRADWGKDYRPNINAVQTYLEANFGDEEREAIMNARAPDGRALMNIPGVLKAFATMAREANPPITIPATGGNQATAITDRIAELQKLQGNKGSEYWKGPKSAAMQQEYRDLIEMREKLKKRDAA